MLTTFSDPLARNLEEKLRILYGPMPRLRERIEVASLNSVALRLAKAAKASCHSQRRRLARQFQSHVLEGTDLSTLGSPQFVLKEWLEVVDVKSSNHGAPTEISSDSKKDKAS